LALDVVPSSGVSSLIIASVPAAAGVVVVTVVVVAVELGVDVVPAVPHAQGAMRPRRH
jgi:hypothetical protein